MVAGNGEKRGLLAKLEREALFSNAGFFCFQNFGSRSHQVLYLPVGENRERVEDPKTRETKEIRTELLITVSNYHFNLKAVKDPKALTCTPKDCKVSIKFASDEFRGKKKDLQEPYFFDKGGFCVSYATFVDLLSSEAFSHTYWSDVAVRYKESSGGADLDKLAVRRDSYGYDEDSSAAPDGGNNKRKGPPKKPQKKAAAGKRNKAAAVQFSDDEDDEDEVGAPNLDDIVAAVSQDLDILGGGQHQQADGGSGGRPARR